MVPTKDYLFILYYLLICVLYFVFRADAEWPSLVPRKEWIFSSQAFLSLVPSKDGYFLKEVLSTRSKGRMHNGLACSLQRMDAGRGWLELQE